MPDDRAADPEPVDDEHVDDEPVDDEPSPDDAPLPDLGPPRLEVAAVAVLLASVVLAVVPATEKVAPVPWVAGMVMVLLSRRWRPGDKALALLGFGILGVPFVLLGRDELAAPTSIVTGVVLVVLWGATAAWLLRRSRTEPEDEGRHIRMR
ncbi:hypothetical protein [Oryzobacter telluris]|uniref:hypothetical protein n=1 Tax=Oryzobacter telluris TaxID=3149179 RepID=UPI00370D1890